MSLIDEISAACETLDDRELDLVLTFAKALQAEEQTEDTRRGEGHSCDV